MPKLNITHLPQRLQKRLDQLERGEVLEARDINVLLNDEQKQRLKSAWSEQKALRKKHKSPKTEEEQKKIGWKTIRDVRIEIYKQAIAETETNLLDAYKDELKRLEVKKARVFMDAWSKSIDEGKGGDQAKSAGNIALQRAGFDVPGTSSIPRRDKEIRKLEQQILEAIEDELNDEEREHLEWLREGQKGSKKTKKV